MKISEVQAVLGTLPLGAFVMDEELNVVWSNHYFDTQFFLKEYKKTNVASFNFIESEESMIDLFSKAFHAPKPWSQEHFCEMSCGKHYHCNISVHELDEVHVLVYLQRSVDVIEQCDDLLKTTRYDHVTSLVNRSYFLELLGEKLLEHNKNKSSLSLLVLDFDSLDDYDVLFTSTDDETIFIELKNKIQEVVGDAQLFGRMSTSKFAIVYEDIVSTVEVEKIAEEIIYLFSEPILVKGHLSYVELTIGVSLYPVDTGNARMLLHKAEHSAAAMQNIEPNSYSFAHKLPEQNVENVLQISTDLPSAIEKEEIYFMFQPQYCHETQRFCGAELLARWEHPELGFISPEVFIPLAEQTGMIRAVTMKAFIEAAKLFKEIEAVGIKNFSLSVNISPSVLLYGDFLEDLKFFMENYEMIGKPLYLEVTENDLARNISKMIEILEEVRAMGILIEMDDYGTGYTSLQYLSKLPIDTLKIDKSFVRDIDTNKHQAVLFKAICEMSLALGYDIVAEGVETKGENLIVASHKKVRVQGYYYARPLLKKPFLELIQKKLQ